MNAWLFITFLLLFDSGILFLHFIFLFCFVNRNWKPLKWILLSRSCFIGSASSIYILVYGDKNTLFRGIAANTWYMYSTSTTLRRENLIDGEVSYFYQLHVTTNTNIKIFLVILVKHPSQQSHECYLCS